MIDTCVQLNRYIACVEAIDAPFLLQQLYKYLTCLTSPSSEALLPVLKRHLDESHTWFAKAKSLSVLSQQTNVLEDALSTVSKDLEPLLRDIKRRLEHYVQRADKARLDEITQICHGMQVLFDEKLGLDEIREEITGFLNEKSYHFDPGPSKEVCEQRLAKLEKASVVHSLKQLSIAAKRLPIQTDLFLKKYSVAEEANVSALQLPDTSRMAEAIEALSSLDEAESLETALVTLENNRPSPSEDLLRLRAQRAVNQQSVNQIFEDIKTSLEQGRQLLSEKVFQRLSSKISILTIAKVQQNYVQAEKSAVQQADSDEDMRRLQSLYAKIQQKKETIFQQKQQKEMAENEAQYRALEEVIEQVTEKIVSVKQSLDEHRKRLACVEKLKQCYSRYSPVLLCQFLEKECQTMKQTLGELMHSLEVDVPWARLEKEPRSIQSLQIAQRESRMDVSEVEEQIDVLMTLLGTHLVSASHAKPSVWQEKLNRLLLHAKEDKLREFLAKFSRIASIPKAYLRLILLAKFPHIEKKLTLNTLGVMITWQEPNVDANVIKSTLANLGLRLTPENFVKICPPKKWSVIDWLRNKFVKN